MLMLLFCVGEDRYALPCRRIVEIVSVVKLKKQPQSPDYVAGLLNYRSQIIPVIDLCQLIDGKPCHSRLSTRIIIVNYLSHEGTTHRLGLMAERVTETLDSNDAQVSDSQLNLDSGAYLGEIMTVDQEMIHCLRVDALLLNPQIQHMLKAIN